MKRKLISLLIMTAMLIAVMPATAESDLEFVTLDWYIGQREPVDKDMVFEGINEMLKEKFNCNVNIHFWYGGEYWDNMRTMITAGQDVGIIGFGNQTALNYIVEANRGAYYPLDELLQTVGKDTYALFPENVWDGMRVNGKIYGIPSKKDNCTIISLKYNVTMAEELGIDMSDVSFDTFDELNDLFYEVKEKRDAAHPEWADIPVCWYTDTAFPYYYQFERTLNHNYSAVFNISGIESIPGYDCDTAINFYDTDEFMELAKLRQRWVADGIQLYDYNGKNELQYTGGVFAWSAWGDVYTDPNAMSPDFEVALITCNRIFSETSSYFNGTAISANCAEPERAMMILNEVNTNPEFATMIRFGLDGVHYTYDDEGKMQFTERYSDPQSRGYYFWYMAPVGNLFIANAPESLTGPDRVMMERINYYNGTAKLADHMGFALNTENVLNEVAACENIISEYQPILMEGKLNSEEEVVQSVNEFREKLKANGVDKITDEAQRQIEEFNASR